VLRGIAVMKKSNFQLNPSFAERQEENLKTAILHIVSSWESIKQSLNIVL
jgi:hypothetical protein